MIITKNALNPKKGENFEGEGKEINKPEAEKSVSFILVKGIVPSLDEEIFFFYIWKMKKTIAPEVTTALRSSSRIH